MLLIEVMFQLAKSDIININFHALTRHSFATLKKNKIEGTARYAGLLLAPAEDFGRGLFCTLS